VISPLDRGRALLAYHSLDPARSEIILHQLNSRGEILAPSPAPGEPVTPYLTLAGGAGDSATVDIATDEKGGALVYSIEPAGGLQVRFRKISVTLGDDLRDMVLDEVRLVTAPERPRGASIAKLIPGYVKSGYVVAYRALARDDVATKIRVLFADEVGHAEGSNDVYWAGDHGNRTSVKVSNDGRVALSWSDSEDGVEEPTLVNLWCMQ
jgi:hypothetical protein